MEFPNDKPQIIKVNYEEILKIPKKYKNNPKELLNNFWKELYKELSEYFLKKLPKKIPHLLLDENMVKILEELPVQYWSDFLDYLLKAFLQKFANELLQGSA